MYPAQLFAALMPALGWSLLHFVWQGVLIGWAASLALHLLRNARPQARYAVACAALLLCAALPLGGTVWRVLEAARGYGAAPVMTAIALPAGDVVAAAIGPAALDTDQLVSWRYLLQRQLPWLVLLWACGAAVMTLRLSMGLLWVRDRTMASRHAGDPHWQRRLDQLARRLGLGRAVRLAMADGLDGPMTAGCWKPVVLVPASLITGMPPDLLEALLAHELAHIKRHDYLVNLVQSAIEILLFYHPAVWTLSRRIRVEREQIADDLAASTLGEPRRLALALTELDRFQFSTPQLAHAAHGGNLMSRIKRLVRPASEPLSWKIAAPLLGLCTACAVLYAHAAPAVDAPVAPATPALDAPAPPPPPVMDVPAVPAPPKPVSAVPAVPAVPAAPAPPAPPAIPAPPAAPPAPAPEDEHASAGGAQAWRSPRGQGGAITFGHLSINYNAKDAYAVKRGDGYVSVHVGRGDMEEVRRLDGAVKGDFIWFRDGGKAWLIKDPALLAKASAAWAQSDALNQKMKEQNQVMEQHNKAMAALGDRMQALSEQAARQVRGERHGKIERLAREQEAVARKMEAVARKMERSRDTGADREALRREMETLETRMEPLKRQMGQLSAELGKMHGDMAATHAPMEALSAEMREASKPLRELGAKMGELGREQGRLSREADQTVRALIQEAVRNGRAEAIPAPKG
ncbi:M56 family metallopeptidase [Pseudoduganella namucuonensis]|uniref:Signal transducer regulating beta-lactamase production, contains metallopeptidase domain n=1 Tax=Pseudoduganella namucuonensis TaxID=1035707 RepID=A0A1I7EUQ2_9BURK|nr:M56 family metallopeptidase [Pseudoduganella namucuonensis]SFU27640.1 Signal transducer regulating beta-lactamase production, contains metallopeptidase domain [Pseudoduganella namucuonensis]